MKRLFLAGHAPILFETAHTFTKQNPLTGDYFVFPKANCQRLDNLPYICDGIGSVSQMAQTMDHYEKTGQRTRFSTNRKYLKKVRVR
jgi:hypothetical protein